ncbi:MAG TPA: POTRA domain-containing protein [Candidatus Sulfotelmatobacter sp.]|nr:POTRA domain-containing protein [Candidatus Sulfotelmatobacter sp.]
MLRRYATSLTAMILLWSAGLPSQAMPNTPASGKVQAADQPNQPAAPANPQPTSTQESSPSASRLSGYEGKLVQTVELPGVEQRDREHLLQLLPQKTGAPLDRAQVGDSIRALYATGRFADIQAEVTPSGEGVVLTFATSANFFVGAVNVEGAPDHPNANQIVNASKFQLGERYTREKLNRALENIRQILQEDGYYRALVTAETTSNEATQQVDVLFHIKAGEAAHVGEVTVTGASGLSTPAVMSIAHMDHGDRVSSAHFNSWLQRLRKKFQKENRVLAQVSVAQQQYLPASNAVDYTFQIDPGPVVEIHAEGYHVGGGVLKKEIPVYEEQAVDDDLLNEGQRNLLDYLQTRGHFDAKVQIQKQIDPQTMRVTYQIDPGPVHKLVLVEITGNKNFLDTAKLMSYLEIQQATRFLSHGRFSTSLLNNDVATLEGLYRSNGFRQVHIQTKVDDDYKGVDNQLAVHIHIEEGERTRVGEVQMVGNHEVATQDLPERSTESGQPYSELNLANDREQILNYYFNHGFPNASLDITTKPSASLPNGEDVTFTIQEGERFTVNQVMVAGTENTRDYVVDREVQVKAGEALSQQDLLDTQTRLYNLGIFSQVDTAVQNPEGDDPQKNVLVQVQEAKRYTFTYGVGLEFQTGQPAGTTAPAGTTGVSPRVGFDVTRLNFAGRDQTITFQSHVGRLQQRGLISYTIPKLFDSDKWKVIYTIFYDNSLDVATFTSQRLEGKIDLRQQIGHTGTEPGTRAGPSSLTYRLEFRRVKASNFAEGINPGEIALFSLPATVGGPGLTFIRDKRDNPLESTKGNYFTLDAFTASRYFASEADFGRVLAQNSTYQAFGGKGKADHQFVFARSTTIGLQQPFRNTRVVAPGACPTNPITNESVCQGFSLIPLPEQFFAGGGNSHRGFGLNQAGPRDPGSGFPLGGTAVFVNSLELRFPPLTLPYLGEGFGLAVFHDMGNVFTAQHDMVKGLLRWHQSNPQQCLSGGTTNVQCMSQFDNSGYDYTSHAVGIGVRYKTPIGPLRFDFGYNLNPTRYFQLVPIPNTKPVQSVQEALRLGHFNVFFSIGQPF